MKRLAAICVMSGLALTLFASTTEEASIKEKVKAIDKELAVMRKNAQADPEVVAARADVQTALNKLNTTVDAVVVRANPKAKDLFAQRKKLVEEFKAVKKTEVEKPVSKSQ